MGHAVINGRTAMLQAVANTLFHDGIEFTPLLLSKVLPDDIPAERKR
jgi:hypothetical protein